MAYNMIFARDRNGGIGLNQSLPWDIPKDLEFFNRQTKNSGLVCSYRTYESLPEAVKQRVTILQSSRDLYLGRARQVFGNITPKFLDAISNDYRSPLTIIGGSSMFTVDFARSANCIYVTEIDDEFECDTFVDKTLLGFLDTLPYKILEVVPACKDTPAFRIKQYYAPYPGNFK